MTPAERLATLKAIRYGLDSAITQAEVEVASLMDTTGADRFNTGLGRVGLAYRSPVIMFDEPALLAFADAADLDGVETVRMVRSTFRELFKINGGEVIFTPTGEAVGFATVRKGSPYLSTRLTAEAKDQAETLLAERLEAVTGLLAVEP